MFSSIYYYKESDIAGDGLLHACYPWDMERSYMRVEESDIFGKINDKGIYWGSFYKHEDFMEKAAEIWEKEFVPAITCMTAEQAIETKSGLRNLSWYRKYLLEISELENSRWISSNMLEKCELIREILNIRNTVISEEFQK